MGRITISLPDDLEARLDQVARERQQPVSQIVATALAGYLDGGSPPPPPPEDGRVDRIEEYLARLAIHVEGIRRFVDEAELWEDDKPPDGYLQPLPPELAPPPWRMMSAGEWEPIPG